MVAAWYWTLNHADRILSFIAIVIAAVAMYDVRHLFQKLEERDKTTEQRVREAVIREFKTHTLSFAAFFRATQFIEFFPTQPDRVTAVAMLMTFRLQQLLYPDAPKEELAELRKVSRKQLEDAAKGYAETIIASGLGKLKDGFDFLDQSPNGK